MEVAEKKYKQTEIGVIPSDWDIDVIKNIAEIKTGSRNTQDRIEDGEFPFFVRSQTVERINSYSYDGEAVLTAGDGVGVGKVIHYVNGKFDCHQRVYRISDFCEKVNGYFFFLYFNNNFLGRVMQMTAKSSVDSVRMEMIADMPIPLPPTLTEQTAIATALSDADSYIASLEKFIAKKRLIKQGAMQQLLASTSSAHGKPKEGWMVKRLGEIGEFKNGINKGAEDFGFGYPFVNLMDVFSISKISSNKHLCLINSNDTDRRMYNLKKGDVLFIRSSVKPEGVGLTCLIEQDLEQTVFSGFIIRFRESGFLTDKFKEYCFSSEHFRTNVIACSSVSANTNINQDALKNLLLHFPKSKLEQINIASILSDMDAEITTLEKQLDKARQIKQGMMQQLLTGKIRLV